MKMEKLISIAALCLALCTAMASAAPVMPSMPDIAYLFDSVSTGATPCFVSGPPSGTVHGAILSPDVPITYAGNNSLSFNGSSDYVDVVNHASFNITGDLTIAVWCKKDTTTEYGGLIGKLDGQQNGVWDYFFSISSNDPMKLGFRALALGGFVESNVSTKVDTSWHHYAVVRSGGTLTFYKDGVADTPIAYSADPMSNNNVPLLIGVSAMWVEAFFFDGRLDEPAIWGRALSGNEIEWLAQNSISNIPEPATIGLLGLGTLGTVVLRRKR